MCTSARGVLSLHWDDAVLTPMPVPSSRERRKQRFTELEAALDQLSEQVQGGRAENQALTDQNTALQARTSHALLLHHRLQQQLMAQSVTLTLEIGCSPFPSA